MVDFLTSFGILFLIVVGFAIATKLLRQPLILGYVAAGILFSYMIVNEPSFDGKIIVVFGDLGITFLLFLIGLEFDLKSLRYLGKDVIVIGLAKCGIFLAIGFLFSLGFGFSAIEAVYLGIIFMGSSTLLVAKWLEDKKESATLHGRIILGILVIEDSLTILAMTILGVANEGSLLLLLLAPVSIIVFLLFALFLWKYILNALLKFASHVQELLFVVSLGICFLFVVIAPTLKQSPSIGAFIAGVLLANTIYGSDVSARLRPLISFFNILFFVGMGFQLELGSDVSIFGYVIFLVLATLLIRPIVLYFLFRWRGYDAKTAFYPAIYPTALTEFGIILVAGGAAILGSEISMIAIISIIGTMVISSYILQSADKIYERMLPVLQYTDRWFKNSQSQHIEKEIKYEVFFFGYYELSKELTEKFISSGKKVIVVDNDPRNIAFMKKHKINYIFNSASNYAFFESLDFSKTELVVSSMIDFNDNRRIIAKLKDANPKGVVIVNARSLKDALDLYDLGADHVLYPTIVNEQQVSILLEDYTSDTNKVISKKLTEITKLKERHTTFVEHDDGFLAIDDFIKQLGLK